jgi:hypothetical protein
VTARALALTFAIVTSWLLTRGDAVAYGDPLTIGVGVAAWLCLVHASRRGYRLWMTFADLLRETTVRVLFTVLYLLVVPLFRVVLWARDPLHLRRPRQDSAWMRKTVSLDANSLERMG